MDTDHTYIAEDSWKLLLTLAHLLQMYDRTLFAILSGYSNLQYQQPRDHNHQRLRDQKKPVIATSHAKQWQAYRL